MGTDMVPSSQPDADDTLPCPVCNQVNRLKRVRTCSHCDRAYHLTCVNITQAQSSLLPVWHCDACLRATNQRDAPPDVPGSNDAPPDDMAAALADLKANTRVLDHVPRRHRHNIASDLAGAITAALEQRTPLAWWRLYSFIFRSPIAEAADRQPSRQPATRSDPETASAASDEALARQVQRKCTDGDIRAALRLLTSPDSISHPSEETSAALRAKHPSAAPDEALPEPPEPGEHRLHVEEADVLHALKDTASGAAAGLDGLRPMHLVKLVAKDTAEAGRRLTSALTALINAAIAGDIPEHARQTFFSAHLVAIKKKDGGVRPIAIGSIYRRLASKILARRMSSALTSELKPVQLGVGVRMGCEAAVHAVREFTDIHTGTPDYVVAKLDLSNAFNAVHRSAVLREVFRRFPAAAPLVSQAYSQPTPLYFGTTRIMSSRGVQQGDPLGPILFALALDPAIQDLTSPLNLWFLDDGTIAGPLATVTRDLRRLFPCLQELGLEVNPRKCEVTHLGVNPSDSDPTPRTEGSLTAGEHSTVPHANGATNLDNDTDTGLLVTDFFNIARRTPLPHLSILGAPIHAQGHGEALSAIDEITRTLVDRTATIGSHPAFFFLSRYAAVPRAIYLLRASPVYAAEESLQAIDDRLRAATSQYCNVDLDEDSWTQASLPLRHGGLGLRRLTDVALPAYIASAEAARELVCTINHRPNGDRPARLVSAIEAFKANKCPDLDPDLNLTQRNLDELASKHRFEDLLTRANQVNRARLLAAASPHSGAWLSAIPAERLGLLLPDEAVRANVALRLGTPVQQTHRCRCGTMSDALGHHSLSCHRNQGRLPRHAALNDVVYRALAAAGLAAILEPRGLDRGDGRRPDGITVFPFRQGRMLMWDSTCVNTFATTHIIDCASSAGAAARAAEDRKRQRYAALALRYDFAPLAVETSGALGPAFSDLLQEIGKRIRQRSGEARETAWLRQRVSMAVARGNAAAICSPWRL